MPSYGCSQIVQRLLSPFRGTRFPYRGCVAQMDDRPLPRLAQRSSVAGRPISEPLAKRHDVRWTWREERRHQ